MPTAKSKLSLMDRTGYFLSNILLRGVLGAVLLIPYRWRVPFMGWFSCAVLAPLAGYRRRIRENLRLVIPDLNEADIETLLNQVPDNAGRTLIEVFSTAPFMARANVAPLTGPGVDALHAAQKAGKPIILNTAHFGNFYAIRGAMAAHGYGLGSLYRRMANPYFNDFYVRNVLAMGPPIFEQGRTGMRGMLRHLKDGGTLGILNDVHAFGGAPLPFFGLPAITSLVTAELALKFAAVLLPVYAIRMPNGLDFVIDVHAPIPHSDPETMTQALNDDLEAMVRQHMGQWFWIHRRWRDARGRALDLTKPK